MKRTMMAGLLALLTASTASAQVPGITLNLFPRAGVFLPLGSLGEVNGEDLKMKQSFAIGISAELGLPMVPFNVRASLDHALGSGSELGDTETNAEDATITGLAADLVFRLGPSVSPLQPYLLAGVGIRKYDFDDTSPLFTDDDQDFAFHIGAGLSFGIGPLKLVGEVSDYITKFEMQVDDSKLRNDVFAMIGFKIGLF